MQGLLSICNISPIVYNSVMQITERLLLAFNGTPPTLRIVPELSKPDYKEHVLKRTQTGQLMERASQLALHQCLVLPPEQGDDPTSRYLNYQSPWYEIEDLTDGVISTRLTRRDVISRFTGETPRIDTQKAGIDIRVADRAADPDRAKVLYQPDAFSLRWMIGRFGRRNLAKSGELLLSHPHNYSKMRHIC